MKFHTHEWAKNIYTDFIDLLNRDIELHQANPEDFLKEMPFYYDTIKNANIGKWLYCENEFSPVILDVIEKSNYKSFQEFRDAVKKQTVDIQNNILNYKGLYGDSFTFYADHSNFPKINGLTVNYAPEMGFNSPSLQSVWNSGIVTIKKGER